MRRIVPVMLALMLSACLSVGNGKRDITLYEVDVAGVKLPGTAVTWQLTIGEPVAQDLLAGAQIVQRDDDGGFATYAGGAWTESAPRIVQSALVHALEDSGRIVGVARAREGVRGDYLLQLELRAFQVEKRSEASVTIGVKLIRPAQQKVVDAAVFEQRAAIRGHGLGAVVAAFSDALSGLMSRLGEWTLATGEADFSARGKPTDR